MRLHDGCMWGLDEMHDGDGMMGGGGMMHIYGGRMILIDGCMVIIYGGCMIINCMVVRGGRIIIIHMVLR